MMMMMMMIIIIIKWNFWKRRLLKHAPGARCTVRNNGHLCFLEITVDSSCAWYEKKVLTNEGCTWPERSPKDNKGKKDSSTREIDRVLLEPSRETNNSRI